VLTGSREDRVAADDAVLARLDDLIGRAGGFSRDDYAQVRAYAAQAATAVGQIVGRDTDYYRLIDEAGSASMYASIVGQHIGEALRALRSDIANGYLRRQADLIAAEVFGDFLDMAGHLLDNGYHHPAAMLIGAVLEDGLRRLARGAGIAVKSGDDLSALNHRLADNKVYNDLVRKQVGVWADVRNHADHGEWEQVTEPDVRDMYSGVTRFMAERLG